MLSFLAFLLISPSALAAEACSLQGKALDHAIQQRLKISVVYEAESGMLNSNLDEKEIRAEAKKTSPEAKCLRQALELDKNLRDPKKAKLSAGQRELLGRLLCVENSTVSFGLNVHPKRGATSFVRFNAAGWNEISLGGSYLGGTENCETTFLERLRETLPVTEKVVEKSKADSSFRALAPAEQIERALKALKDFGKSPAIDCEE